MEVLNIGVHFEMEESLLISGNYWLWFSIIITWLQLQQFWRNTSGLHRYLNLNVEVSGFPYRFLGLLSCVLVSALEKDVDNSIKFELFSFCIYLSHCRCAPSIF